MRRHLSKRLPTSKGLSQSKYLALLGKSRLLQADLWYFNRYNVARGLAIGLFVAMVPVPGQTLLAACVAFLWRANLPVAIAGAWLTNPLTIVPIFYVNMLVGREALAIITAHEHLGAVNHPLLWQPLVLGSLLVGAILALCSYFTVLLIWRLYVRYSWRKRRQAREL